MNLPTLKLTQQLSRFDESLKKEWLITNELGGYASSTVLGVNTRKYHGLLVAALHPPGNRTVCLSKLDEEIQIGTKVYMLGANEFKGTFFPKGFMHLKEFSISPFPKFAYSIENIEVQKTVFMIQGKNVTIANYRVKNAQDSEIKIRIFPLVTCRHFHSVIDKTINLLNFTQQQNSPRAVQLMFKNPNLTLAVHSTKGEFYYKPNWIERLIYREEFLRGEVSNDDCYQPGYFEINVQRNSVEKFTLVAAATNTDVNQNSQTLNLMRKAISNPDRLFRLETKLNYSTVADFYSSHIEVSPSDWLSLILLATKAFIVKSSSNKTDIIAGYHWFETWGRDAFISLPGLTLATGKFEAAKDTLANFNTYCKDGLIPNFISDKTGQATYNTVDATLLYVNAVLQYLKYTGDFEFVQSQLWSNLKEIFEKHFEGTNFGIHVDTDGLLAHGGRLTWMDAQIEEGKAVTPRAGKAVEIQALWYNALKTMQLLADRFREKTKENTYSALAEKCKTSFNEKFWNKENHYLNDVIGDSEDVSLRPNQIFVVGLDFMMLDPEKNKQVVDLIQRYLVTPYGLRTLDRNDAKYNGIYFGNRQNRDRAYHNGTVWPWLLGQFMTAFRKTKGQTDQNVKLSISSFIWPLFTRHISQAGLGTLSEIFDGDQPHTPRGCIAQAWSVAEPFRAYIEDALQIRPKYEKDVLGI